MEFFEARRQKKWEYLKETRDAKDERIKNNKEYYDKFLDILNNVRLLDADFFYSRIVQKTKPYWQFQKSSRWGQHQGSLQHSINFNQILQWRWQWIRKWLINSTYDIHNGHMAWLKKLNQFFLFVAIFLFCFLEF